MNAGLPAVAQTAPQLYCQLLPLGWPEPELARVRDACLLGARVSAGLLRGSGKPFACHLIGVASLVAETGQGGSDALLAALLHALYQPRVPFAGDLAARRAKLREAFGAKVEALCFAYDAAGVLRADAPAVDPGDETQRVVRILQLADELEDALDGGPWWHGAADDPVDRRGAALDRVARIRALGGQFAAAPGLGAPSIAPRWQGIVDGWSMQQWPAALRSGQYSSFNADPDGD